MEYYNKIDCLDLWYSHECESTFNLLPSVFTQGQWPVVFSFNQTAGKGQNNKTWHSQAFKNLAFSAWLPVCNWALENPVLFNMNITRLFAIALQKQYNLKVKIKWPNDLYCDNLKLAGLLLSVQTANNMRIFQVGIGVNVNQTVFPANIPNPTSIALQSNKEANLYQVAETLAHACIQSLLPPNEDILKEFNSMLWKKSEVLTYSFNGEKQQGKVIQVNKNGQLEVEQNNKIVQFHQGQIQVLIN